MARVDYSQEAGEDLVGIADYIARDKPEAAHRWIQRIREVCETLAMRPEMGELRRGFGVSGCRSFSVGNYILFYRPTSDGIEVARIVHGSRDMRSL